MLRFVSVFLMVIGIISGVARADDAEAARAHFAEGSKAFDLGQYDRAIKEYTAAYDAKPDPAMLYNIAQVHKLAGHAAEAVRFYRVFLSRVPDAANADEVRAKIAELQRAIAQQQKAQAMPPDHVQPPGSVEPSATPKPAPPPPKPAPPPPTVPATTTPTTTTTTTTTTTARDGDVAVERGARPGRVKIAVGVATAALGVAALASGIATSVVAQKDGEELTSIDRQGGVFDPTKDSSGRTLGIAGPTLIGIGAALTITGAVVWIVGARESRRATASRSTSTFSALREK